MYHRNLYRLFLLYFELVYSSKICYTQKHSHIIFSNQCFLHNLINQKNLHHKDDSMFHMHFQAMLLIVHPCLYRFDLFQYMLWIVINLNTLFYQFLIKLFFLISWLVFLHFLQPFLLFHLQPIQTNHHNL